MKPKKFSQNRGLIKAVILIVAALVILGSLGYSLRDILDKPLVKDNLNYAWNGVKFVWNSYLASSAEFVWDKVIKDLVWNNLTKFFGK